MSSLCLSGDEGGLNPMLSLVCRKQSKPKLRPCLTWAGALQLQVGERVKGRRGNVLESAQLSRATLANSAALKHSRPLSVPAPGVGIENKGRSPEKMQGEGCTRAKTCLTKLGSGRERSRHEVEKGAKNVPWKQEKKRVKTEQVLREA